MRRGREEASSPRASHPRRRRGERCPPARGFLARAHRTPRRSWTPVCFSRSPKKHERTPSKRSGSSGSEFRGVCSRYADPADVVDRSAAPSIAIDALEIGARRVERRSPTQRMDAKSIDHVQQQRKSEAARRLSVALLTREYPPRRESVVVPETRTSGVLLASESMIDELDDVSIADETSISMRRSRGVGVGVGSSSSQSSRPSAISQTDDAPRGLSATCRTPRAIKRRSGAVRTSRHAVTVTYAGSASASNRAIRSSTTRVSTPGPAARKREGRVGYLVPVETSVRARAEIVSKERERDGGRVVRVFADRRAVLVVHAEIFGVVATTR